MAEIKRKATVYNTAYLCPGCGFVMMMDFQQGVMWCEENQFPPPDCSQIGVKFEIPRVELTLKEAGTPQVTAT